MSTLVVIEYDDMYKAEEKQPATSWELVGGHEANFRGAVDQGKPVRAFHARTGNETITECLARAYGQSNHEIHA